MTNSMRQAWNGLILLASFAIPFLYVLATDLVWKIGRRIPGSVSDTAIALPSGLPLMLLVCLAWLVGFALLRYFSRPVMSSVVIANMLAVTAFFGLAFVQTNDMPLFDGWRSLILHPGERETNLIPVRLALATVLGFGCSLAVGRYRAKPR